MSDDDALPPLVYTAPCGCRYEFHEDDETHDDLRETYVFCPPHRRTLDEIDTVLRAKTTELFALQHTRDELVCCLKRACHR